MQLILTKKAGRLKVIKIKNKILFLKLKRKLNSNIENKESLKYSMRCVVRSKVS